MLDTRYWIERNSNAFGLETVRAFRTGNAASDSDAGYWMPDQDETGLLLIFSAHPS